MFLQFVDNILSKSRFQQLVMRFWMMGSLQYRSIWNPCFTFDILYFFHIKVFNDWVLSAQIRAMPWLQNIHHLKLLTLRWRSFSGCRREHVPVVFVLRGCPYLTNRYLQPMESWMMQDAKVKMVDAHSQNGAVTMLWSVIPIQAANMSVMNNSDLITVWLLYLQD